MPVHGIRAIRCASITPSLVCPAIATVREFAPSARMRRSARRTQTRKTLSTIGAVENQSIAATREYAADDFETNATKSRHGTTMSHVVQTFPISERSEATRQVR